MLRRSLILGLSAWALTPAAFGQNLTARIFPVGSPPSGCQAIPGLYPVGDRTNLIWTYERYSMVMPPYKKKVAQSFQCGDQKGTLYFFDYATEAQKDHALLFARPVLAKQQGVSHELPVREWSTGFALVSFPETPPELLAALTERLTPKSATPPPAVVVVKTAQEAHTPVVAHQPPVPPKQKPAAPVVPATVKTPVASTPTVAVEPFVQLKPAISAQPFESSEPSTSIQPVKVVEPPKPLVKESPRAPLPVKVKTVHAPKAAALPIAQRIAAPPVGTADLSSSVLESYASKMGCESADRNAQTQTVCGYMQEFASGLPPELPFKAESVLMGPVYTVDANGRFTDLRYKAMVGTQDPNAVSFFALPSTGGKDDFEIKQLIEARKTKTPLPANDMSARVPALAAARHFGLRKTAARSAVIQPDPDHLFFIRRAADHWIVIGVSGHSTEAQLNTSLEVAVLY